jgi:hypothetical protein
MCQAAFFVCEGEEEWEGAGNKEDRLATRDAEHLKLVIVGDEVCVPIVL